MKIIEAKEVYEKLTMDRCIPLMEEALCRLTRGEAFQPMRSVNALPHGNSFGFMPAYLGDHDYFGAKVITAFPCNMGTEYPSHMGYVMLFESVHGSLAGMVDASSITEIRTGAVSGAATKYLARKDAKKLALIGAGAQARSHMQAMKCVRKIEEVALYDINRESAERAAWEFEREYAVKAYAFDSAEEAVRDADIICTLTPCKEPFLKKEWVKPGVHINAVGTFTPNTREVTSELVAASRLYADRVESMKKECGEYLVPLREGLIGEDHIVGELGELILGTIPGRQSEEEITLFDALGLAVEDVCCAKYMYCLDA